MNEKESSANGGMSSLERARLWQAEQKRRSLVLAMLLALWAVIFFVTTVVRIGLNIDSLSHF